MRERLAAEALEPQPMSPEAFGQYIQHDIARWTQLVKAQNLKIE
jgi:tripartite-type tricarboxylate transporter receptor subunit TctC